jgi:acetyl-CoA carboxylase/biotin carboxylase 1
VDAVARRLGDGGLLLQVDGTSHVVHSEKEVGGVRLLVDSRTCLLANEHDPSQVLALSAGKLMRYLVDNGDHVAQDQPYAEVEVMKMVMPLLAPAPGKVAFKMPEGSLLTAGDLIARLDLDDPGTHPTQPFQNSLNFSLFFAFVTGVECCPCLVGKWSC